MTGRRPRAPIIRWFKKVQMVPLGCWMWTGYRNKAGYGVFGTTANKSALAHRFIYEQVHGPIAPGLQIDHLCHNRACVNPGHLEAVTPQVNVDRRLAHRGGNSDKPFCIQGHRFDERNTYRWKNGRYCRACRRKRERERRAALRA